MQHLVMSEKEGHHLDPKGMPWRLQAATLNLLEM